MPVKLIIQTLLIIMTIITYPAHAQLSSQNSQVFKQGVAGLGGVPELGDAFGAAMTACDFNGNGKDDLVVGVALEDIGDLIDAGALHVFTDEQIVTGISRCK